MEKALISTRCINVERVTLTSRKSLQEVLSKFDAAVGHPNIEEFWKRVTAAKTTSEMEKVVQSALGPSGFMEFARFDHGESCTKDNLAAIPAWLGSPLAIR
jgi:hypothetical protein